MIAGEVNRNVRTSIAHAVVVFNFERGTDGGMP